MDTNRIQKYGNLEYVEIDREMYDIKKLNLQEEKYDEYHTEGSNRIRARDLQNIYDIWNIYDTKNRHHNTGLGPHTRTVFVLTLCAYSHGNIIVEMYSNEILTVDT